MVDRIVRTLTSLRLTVICLGFALLLVFIGTVAQVDEGLYQAQTRFFRSILVWWTPVDSRLRIPILPGGYTIGTVLLINLTAAHIKRFRFSRKKLGILMIHAGLIVLLLGQLFTDLLSQESTMQLTRGATSTYSEDLREHELIIVDKTDVARDRVTAIAGWP